MQIPLKLSRVRSPSNNILRRFTISRLTTVVFAVYLVLLIVHFVFRYILQVSDSGTSPHYGDTPVALSLIKDVLMLGLFAGSLPAFMVYRRFSLESLRLCVIVLTAVSLMLGLGLLKIILGDSTAEVLQIWRALWLPLVVILPLSLIPADRILELLRRVAYILLPLCLIFQAVTVFLYLYAGRLPALSYIGRPRFGSVLDDPNGYAILALFLLAALWNRLNWIYKAAIALSILLTFSLSGYGALTIFIVGKFVEFFARRKRSIFQTLGIICLGILLITLVIANLDALQSIIIGKAGSLQEHSNKTITGINQIFELDWSRFFLGITDLSRSGFIESQLLLTFNYNGIIGLLIQFFLIAWMLVRSWRVDINLSLWLISVLICSFSLPYLWISPLNVIIWSVLGAIYFVATSKNSSLKST